MSRDTVLNGKQSDLRLLPKKNVTHSKRNNQGQHNKKDAIVLEVERRDTLLLQVGLECKRGVFSIVKNTYKENLCVCFNNDTTTTLPFLQQFGYLFFFFVAIHCGVLVVVFDTFFGRGSFRYF